MTVGGKWTRRVAAVLGLAAALVALAHPVAGAASDVWGNVGPASPLGAEGPLGRYPLSHYALDQHFDAVSASLTGGVDASGVAPMIAYFLASVLWALTSFLASLLIELFAFAFGLDLLRGSEATGGAGALGPVARAIHSIYRDVFGAPWLVLAVAVAGIWAMWRALVQRRYAETAGALGLSLVYVVAALFFVAQPAKTIGAASAWTDRMSQGFLAIATHGSPSGGARARDDGARQLFDLLVFKPWVVLEFGGLEHCAVPGTGSGDSDPDSVAVRPLSRSPGRDAELSRRLGAQGEVAAEGKTCISNANKYAHRFLRHGPGTDERDAEYEALDRGDAAELPGPPYRLGPADRPATDAMEEGGQYQRLLVAIVVFCGELGAFLLLGALAVGVILAQVLLLLVLAFAPVALVAAAIPGRGHDFFRGWLEKLAGLLLRKAAYSLLLAVLLAVNGALAAATSQLGWLMSFGLQAFFFWAVFLQRRALTEGLVGIATGPRAPGREGALRVLALYHGARGVSAPLRRRGRRGQGRTGSRPQGPPEGEGSDGGGEDTPSGPAPGGGDRPGRAGAPRPAAGRRPPECTGPRPDAQVEREGPPGSTERAEEEPPAQAGAGADEQAGSPPRPVAPRTRPASKRAPRPAPEPPPKEKGPEAPPRVPAPRRETSDRERDASRPRPGAEDASPQSEAGAERSERERPDPAPLPPRRKPGPKGGEER